MDFSSPTGPKLHALETAPQVLQPKDFHSFNDARVGTASVLEHDYFSESTLVGELTTVYRKGSELHLQYAWLDAKGCSEPTIFRTDCGGEGGGYCPRTICPVEEKTSIDVVLDYSFTGCSEPAQDSD